MTYNRGFEFWNEEHRECNCGSYAFNLDEWYCPGYLSGTYDDDDCEIPIFLGYCEDDGMTEDELANQLAGFYLDKIKKDFKDSIRILCEQPRIVDLKDNEELIAFRAGAYSWGGCNCSSYDYDFHFKVYRDGRWLEKKGSLAINFTTLDDWMGSLYYNSETFYIIHRFKNLTSIEKNDILYIE